MKVLYHCFGGTHSSVLAAAVHTGMLAPDEIPTPDKLLSLPLYDKQDGDDYGRIHYYGQDPAGHQVYIVGRRNHGAETEMILAGLYSAFGLQTGLKVVDSTPALNWAMQLGGYLSRGMGLKAIGRFLVTWGSRKAYRKVVGLVDEAKKELPED
ncbi:DUF3189 family protein [Candidatus Desulforudis audaxviator]|uniref:DUF3189 family protein n=1 Tax=Desulforudis audaxviator (strain MP104C) TaxID=477974 RepID=B1I465_DESAP|nr:DUF3189 family protein [Candidatus Desulforudis audaxviator]ACA59686.1 conserved hypothetical protein [Candidatus Desulforudis audaxviator MP104C]AZK59679.1 hypothetical protein Daudx_1129 [Candidatus Desulforudis audaxviator]